MEYNYAKHLDDERITAEELMFIDGKGQNPGDAFEPHWCGENMRLRPANDKSSENKSKTTHFILTDPNIEISLNQGTRPLPFTKLTSTKAGNIT